MTPNQIIVYCGLLLSISAFSVDILLPAFGGIAASLPADYARVQMTIPIFLAAIGIGQLFTGPLSDRFGRRPVLLGSLAVFSAGSLLCFVAPDIETLLAGRALQGIGASGGPVVARAVLRDMFTGRQLAANIALATMVFSFGPIVAPLAGVAIMQFGDWRLIFGAILAFGLLLLAVGLAALPETIRETNPMATRFSRLYANAGTVLAHPQSRFYGLLLGPVLTLMIIILVSVPRVYRDSFGIEGAHFALLFAIHGIGIIFGQSLNRYLINRQGPEFALLSGSGIAFGSAVLMNLFHMAGILNAYVLSFTLVLFAMGFLTMVANATALALDPHGSIAGFVSSFFESLGRIVSASLAAALSFVIAGSLDNFLIGLAVTTLSVLGLILLGQRRISAKIT